VPVTQGFALRRQPPMPTSGDFFGSGNKGREDILRIFVFCSLS
jgi:hypothetical protein